MLARRLRRRRRGAGRRISARIRRGRRRSRHGRRWRALRRTHPACPRSRSQPADRALPTAGSPRSARSATRTGGPGISALRLAERHSVSRPEHRAQQAQSQNCRLYFFHKSTVAPQFKLFTRRVRGSIGRGTRSRISPRRRRRDRPCARLCRCRSGRRSRRRARRRRTGAGIASRRPTRGRPRHSRRRESPGPRWHSPPVAGRRRSNSAIRRPPKDYFPNCRPRPKDSIRSSARSRSWGRCRSKRCRPSARSRSRRCHCPAQTIEPRPTDARAKIIRRSRGVPPPSRMKVS